MNTINNMSSGKIYIEFLNMIKDGEKLAHDTNDYNYVSMANPGTKFKIPHELNQKFMNLYVKTLLSGYPLHIQETRKSVSPLILDFDWKYSSDSRLYTYNTIQMIIVEFNNIIKKYLKLEDNKYNIACVFEKEKPTKYQNYMKDGIHIMYPYIYARSNLRAIMLNELLKAANDNHWFNDWDLIETMDNVIDNAVIKNNWLLYGSKKPEKSLYDLTCFYFDNKLIFDNDILSQSFPLESRPCIFSVRKSNNPTPYNNFYDDDQIENIYGDMFSVEKKVNSKYVQNPENVNKAIKLAKLLSKDRAAHYQSWICVGWCLHNISDILFDSWIEFSKLCPDKFDYNYCIRVWNDARNNMGYTIGSLIYWAREDNLQGYISYLNDELKTYFTDSPNNTDVNTDYNIAQTIYNYSKSYIVCVSLQKTNTLWYEYKNNLWKICYGATTLQKLMSEEVSEIYINMAKVLGTLSYSDDKNTDAHKKKSDIMYAIGANKLKSDKHKTSIINQAKHLFFNSDFLQKLDENRNLLLFNNGIYDLQLGVFRNGTPDDMVSISSKIDYIPYDISHPYIIDIDNFISELQPNPDMKKYLLFLLASCLEGHVRNESFHIFTGSGSNGKSLLMNLLSYALGDYVGTFNITMLTGKLTSSSQASPDLAKLKGKRVAIFHEPEKQDKLNIGLIKQLSGGDKIYARQLYCEPFEFTPQAKYFLLCNDLPTINSSDGGIWRRIKVVNFGVKFVDEPKLQFERKINRDLKYKMELWAPYFIGYLLETYKEYIKLGFIPEPMEVSEATFKYRERADIIRNYIIKNIDYNNDGKLSLTDVWNSFKSWYINEYNTSVPFSKPDFKDMFTDKIGVKFSNDKYEGISIKEN